MNLELVHVLNCHSNQHPKVTFDLFHTLFWKSGPERIQRRLFTKPAEKTTTFPVVKLNHYIR